tara:strand:+ start:1836 stop:2057 length:222 start_codon:yes stop_codon:yes gene_type:complete
MFTVFVRNWFKYNPSVINELDSSLNGIEPDSRARKYKLATFENEVKAREYCKEYNKTHKKGKLRRQAEYTQYY